MDQDRVADEFNLVRLPALKDLLEATVMDSVKAALPLCLNFGFLPLSYRYCCGCYYMWNSVSCTIALGAVWGRETPVSRCLLITEGARVEDGGERD